MGFEELSFVRHLLSGKVGMVLKTSPMVEVLFFGWKDGGRIEHPFFEQMHEKEKLGSVQVFSRNIADRSLEPIDLSKNPEVIRLAFELSDSLKLKKNGGHKHE